MFAALLCVPVLGFAASTALAQDGAPPADPAPTTAPKPDPAPPPPPPPPKAKPKPPPPPPPPPPEPEPPAVVVPPPPPPPNPKREVERRKEAAANRAKRKNARSKAKTKAPEEEAVRPSFLPNVKPLPEPRNAAVPKKSAGTSTSPLIGLLLLAAAGLALVAVALAALPLPALERLLSAETHWRTEQVAGFVDGHRLDLVVAGVATLLVAFVVALPSVTG